MVFLDVLKNNLGDSVSVSTYSGGFIGIIGVKLLLFFKNHI